MGIGGEIFSSIITTKIEKDNERKIGEATSTANKLAKEKGLSAEEAEEEISKSEERAKEEIVENQKKANKFFTVIVLSLIAILFVGWLYETNQPWV